MPKIKIGKKLLKARTHWKLSQSDISDETGIHRIELSRYENDRVLPGIENLVKLCLVLELSIDDLIFGEL